MGLHSRALEPLLHGLETKSVDESCLYMSGVCFQVSSCVHAVRCQDDFTLSDSCALLFTKLQALGAYRRADENYCLLLEGDPDHISFYQVHGIFLLCFIVQLG